VPDLAVGGRIRAPGPRIRALVARVATIPLERVATWKREEEEEWKEGLVATILVAPRPPAACSPAAVRRHGEGGGKESRTVVASPPMSPSWGNAGASLVI
jgi:hypothetical protein